MRLTVGEVFDFDSKDDMGKAQDDAKTLAARLMSNCGFNQDDFRIFFSVLVSF